MVTEQDISVREQPIIFTGDNPRLILDLMKTQTRRVVTPSTSEVGEGKVDWSKFCWDGSQIYLDTCRHGHIEEHKAPLPFIDGRANEHYPYEHQYLHVPYNWREDMTIYRIYPRWKVGDRLWVRESHRLTKETYKGELWVKAEYRFNYGNGSGFRWFKWDDIPGPQRARLSKIRTWGKWRPARFMYKFLVRGWLEITEVRVERLQEITVDGVCKEGCPWHLRQPFVAPEKVLTWFEQRWDLTNGKRDYGWGTNPFVWVISFEVVERFRTPSILLGKWGLKKNGDKTRKQ